MHSRLWLALLVCGLQIPQLLTADAQASARLSNPGEQSKPTTQSPQPSKPNLHLNPGYQMFARQIALPAMTTEDEHTINISGKRIFHLNLIAENLTQEKTSVAEQLQVPVAVITTFLQRIRSNALPSPDCAARFRAVIIDYKYLHEKWSQYRPSPGNEKLKIDALQCLEAGDIEKAWDMFTALSRPPTPGGLRVQSQG